MKVFWISISTLVALAASSKLGQKSGPEHFQACTNCLADPTKKYCRGRSGNACCDLSDNESEGCNDRKENVMCSDTFERQEGIVSKNVPPSTLPDFYKYTICPQDMEICGLKKAFTLTQPANRAILIDHGFELKADIPPGYVCAYTINIQQENNLPDATLMTNIGLSSNNNWMVEFQINDVHTHSEKFSAHLIYEDNGSDNVKYFDYDILTEDCDAEANHCTRNVRERGRNFFFSEKTSDTVKLRQV